jgi:hypothetical protein
MDQNKWVNADIQQPGFACVHPPPQLGPEQTLGIGPHIVYDNGVSSFFSYAHSRESCAMATTTTTDALSLEHEAFTVLPDQQKQQPPPTATSERKIEPLSIESAPDTEPNYPTGSKFWFTIIALCVVVIVGGLDANIVSTAVPSITNHFHTVADVGWYSSAFRLCTCAFQFGFAKLYKLFSIKVIFLISNVIFLVGSLLCATAASSTMFIVGRAVTGLGFSGELAGCFAVVVHILPLKKRPAFAGLMACVESLAIIAAPIVGGALTQSLGWRWCFWYARLVTDMIKVA